MAVAALASLCFLLVLEMTSAFVPTACSAVIKPSRQERADLLSKVACQPVRVYMSHGDVSESRQGFLQDSAAAIASGAVAVSVSAGAAGSAQAAQVSAWRQIELPVATVLYDITFDPSSPDHGLIVGAQGTFLEVRLSKLALAGCLRVLQWPWLAWSYLYR